MLMGCCNGYSFYCVVSCCRAYTNDRWCAVVTKPTLITEQGMHEVYYAVHTKAGVFRLSAASYRVLMNELGTTNPISYGLGCYLLGMFK